MKLTTKLLRKLIREAMNEADWSPDYSLMPDGPEKKAAKAQHLLRKKKAAARDADPEKKAAWEKKKDDFFSLGKKEELDEHDDDRDSYRRDVMDRQQARVARMAYDLRGEPDEPSTFSSEPFQKPKPRRWAKRRSWPAWDKRAGWRGYEPAPEGILNVPAGHFEMDESGQLVVGSQGTMNTINATKATRNRTGDPDEIDPNTFFGKIKRGIESVEGYNSLVGHQFLKSDLDGKARAIEKYLNLEPESLTAEQVHDAIKSVIQIKSWG